MRYKKRVGQRNSEGGERSIGSEDERYISRLVKQKSEKEKKFYRENLFGGLVCLLFFFHFLLHFNKLCDDRKHK